MATDPVSSVNSGILADSTSVTSSTPVPGAEEQSPGWFAKLVKKKNNNATNTADNPAPANEPKKSFIGSLKRSAQENYDDLKSAVKNYKEKQAKKTKSTRAFSGAVHALGGVSILKALPAPALLTLGIGKVVVDAYKDYNAEANLTEGTTVQPSHQEQSVVTNQPVAPSKGVDVLKANLVDVDEDQKNIITEKIDKYPETVTKLCEAELPNKSKLTPEEINLLILNLNMADLQTPGRLFNVLNMYDLDYNNLVEDIWKRLYPDGEHKLSRRV